MHLIYTRTSLETQSVKNLSVMQEIQIQSLGGEDPLEKGMATHSKYSCLELHGQRSLANCSPRGHKESDTTEGLNHHYHTHTDTQIVTTAGGRGETKDHTIRFSDTEQKDKEKIEDDFIFLLDPSFVHQIYREPTSLSHRIWLLGIPKWLSGKEYACQCRRHRFDPWVG